MHRIFWIAIILSCCMYSCSEISGKHHSECQKKNNDFATTNAQFIQCATQHNQNATGYCLHCSDNYSQTVAAYHDLTAGNDTIDCRPDYVDNNLLSLVVTLMSSTQHIWDMAYCSDCFDGMCDGKDPVCVESDRTKTFVSLYNETFACIQANKQNSCKICGEEYNNLTALHDQLRKQTDNKFCFDLKSMMNQTQKLWSREYHCCDEKNPPVIEFYMLSASSFFVALLFYGVAFLYGIRKQEIPFIPDDLLPPHHSRSANDSSVSVSDNEHPTTSANILETPKHIESSHESDDDEQPILFHPISNPNLIEIS